MNQGEQKNLFALKIPELYDHFPVR